LVAGAGAVFEGAGAVAAAGVGFAAVVAAPDDFPAPFADAVVALAIPPCPRQAPLRVLL